jgi:spore coat polysaccharide biosynthesis protein SpsF
MKTKVIVQARMSSLRLPGKMMRPLWGLPLYFAVIERCSQTQGIDGVVLATSHETSDDILAQDAKRRGVCCFRGDLKNVLKRFLDCAEIHEIDTIIRVCGDSPFVDVEWISKAVKRFRKDPPDYVGWDKKLTIAGLDSEVVTKSALEKASSLVLSLEDKEHVTQFIRQNPRQFKTYLHGLDAWHQRQAHQSLTVDTADDYERIQNIARQLGPDGAVPLFSTKEVLSCLVSLNQEP